MTGTLGNSTSLAVFQVVVKAFSLQGLMKGSHLTDGLLPCIFTSLACSFRIGLWLNEKGLPPASPRLGRSPVVHTSLTGTARLSRNMQHSCRQAVIHMCCQLSGPSRDVRPRSLGGTHAFGERGQSPFPPTPTSLRKREASTTNFLTGAGVGGVGCSISQLSKISAFPEHDNERGFSECFH